MACIWVLSDTHFGHENMTKFTRQDGTVLRPFANAAEMDEALVDNWNKVVRPQDHVYHLGDVAMARRHLATVARCNGHKRLVRGNHDIFRTKEYLEHFEEIYGVRVLDNIIFSHIPIHPVNMGRFRANVHGHMHENDSPEGNYYSVCLERINYTPISLEDLKVKLDSFS
jgi:calcineurin-like phosphoesterase family protein